MDKEVEAVHAEWGEHTYLAEVHSAPALSAMRKKGGKDHRAIITAENAPAMSCIKIQEKHRPKIEKLSPLFPALVAGALWYGVGSDSSHGAVALADDDRL